MLRTRQEDLLETRLEGLRRSLSITDRVLADRNVILTFGRKAKATSPAHSTGDRITIELGLIPDLGTSSALVEILGLNYHELAHVRYGVKRDRLFNSVFPSQRHARFLEAYRVMEEARVETLLAAKYAKMKKYFAYPVIKYYVKDQRAWPTAFLFTHGRRYLPLKIRDTFRDMFDQKFGGASEFADLIDKYRTIAFTDDQRIRTGALLINEFAKLMEKYNLPAQNIHDSTEDDTNPDPRRNTRYENTTKKKSSEDTQNDSEQAKSQTEKQDKEEESGEDGSGFHDEEEEEGEDGEPEDGGGEKDSDDQSDESGDSDQSQDSGGGQDQEGDGSSPGDASNQGDDGNQGTDRSSGSGSGKSQQQDSLDKSGPNGKGQGGGNAPPPAVRSRREPTKYELRKQRQELIGEMSDVIDTVLSDEDVQTDVENLKSAMDDDAGLSSSLARHENSRDDVLVPVTTGMLSEADRLKDELRKLWALMEPGWQYGLAEGNRIDMQRAAMAQTADDYDSIYADWQEGQQENSGIEVVIVADESGSTDDPVPLPEEDHLYYMDKTKKATVISRQIWELMYALQEVEARVTVLSFESECRTLYDRDDRVTTKGYVHLTPRGGTNPTKALIEATRIFRASEMPNKLLIVISDGQWDWWAIQNCPAVLDQIEGVTKVSALIDTDGEDEDEYEFGLADKFDVVRRTNGPIFDVMADAVTRIVEGNVNR